MIEGEKATSESLVVIAKDKSCGQRKMIIFTPRERERERE